MLAAGSVPRGVGVANPGLLRTKWPAFRARCKVQVATLQQNPKSLARHRGSRIRTTFGVSLRAAMAFRAHGDVRGVMCCIEAWRSAVCRVLLVCGVGARSVSWSLRSARSVSVPRIGARCGCGRCLLGAMRCKRAGIGVLALLTRAAAAKVADGWCPEYCSGGHFAAELFR